MAKITITIKDLAPGSTESLGQIEVTSNFGQRFAPGSAAHQLGQAVLASIRDMMQGAESGQGQGQRDQDQPAPLGVQPRLVHLHPSLVLDSRGHPFPTE